MIAHDISINAADCKLYPGDPQTKIISLQSIEKGDSCNLSAVNMCLHAGTHIDAPLHFIKNGKGIMDIGLAPFIGECTVISVKENITGKFIEEHITPRIDRVLFRTEGEFYLDRTGAYALVDTKIQLVGIDAMSIAADFDEDVTHIKLLQNGIYILEGLNLKGIRDGNYMLFAPPINIGNTEAAPCRALLIEKESGIEPLPVFNKRRLSV